MAELKKTKGNPTGIAETPAKPKRELPRVTFTADDLPEIKNWSVGGKYKLEIEVEQVAAEKDRYGYEDEKTKPLTATFKVTAVKAAKNTPAKDSPGPKMKDGNPNKVGY